MYVTSHSGNVSVAIYETVSVCHISPEDVKIRHNTSFGRAVVFDGFERLVQGFDTSFSRYGGVWFSLQKFYMFFHGPSGNFSLQTHSYVRKSQLLFTSKPLMLSLVSFIIPIKPHVLQFEPHAIIK